MQGSVKVMLSYDYCHFEVALSSDQDMTTKEINELRKKTHRLADEAVRQYITAKSKAQQRVGLEFERNQLRAEVGKIRKRESVDWTPEEKAKVKTLEDRDYWAQHDYDYDDDYEF